MNKIYKVIWSKVKNQYVVTSEFAHSCTKSTTSRVGKSAVAALAAFVLTAGVGGVQAAELNVTVNNNPVTVSTNDKEGLQELLNEAGIPVGTVNGEHSIAIGEGSIVKDGSKDAMAIGFAASAAKNNTIAFGSHTDAGSIGAIAIGNYAKAKYGFDAMALGNYATATGTEALAIGKEATSGGNNSVAMGNNANVDEWSQGAIAIGKDSSIHGVYSVAIGQGSSTSEHSAVAIGRNSHANGIGSVALGYSTNAQAEGSVALGDFSTATEANTVSVGNDTLKRQITNVAAGTKADDVVTVGQLQAASDEATKTIHGVTLDEGTVTATDVNVVGGDLYVQTNKEDGSTGAEFHVRQSDGLTYMRNLADGGLSTFNVGDGGAAFVKTNASGEESLTTIDGGAITTDSIDTKTLTLNGVDFGETLGTIGDNTQHISHVNDGYGLDYTKVEGTYFYADGSMNTAKGEFAVYADGSVHSSQNFETKSDVVVVNDDYTPLYSLRNIGNNVQKISYNEDADMTLVNSGFTVESGHSNFTVADGMASLNVGGNTLGMTSEGTTFTNGGSQTVINGGTITTDKLVVGGVDIGTVAGTATETADKVQNIEHGVDGNGTSYTKVEGVTMKEDGTISAGANGEFVVGTDGTVNTSGSILSYKGTDNYTEIDGGNITTGNLNVDTINGKEVGDFATTSDVSGIKDQIGATGENGKLNLSNGATTIESGINKNTAVIGDVSTLKGTNASGVQYTNLTDAVNGNYDRIEQNTTAIAQNSQAINSLGHRVSDLGDEIDSVGAISAALAGLHPLDYDGTGSKFQISAAMGTYDGTQAAAIGGFYHFNRDVMMSLGGATSFEGSKKTAANIGVTFRVGEGASGKSVSDDVMARLEAMDQKIAALEQENKDLKNVLGAIDTSLSKEFPDVPANHWAYEAVTKLAGNDVVAGYPDGEFHGDRTMTRYEMAEIIYKAMSKGVQVDQKLVDEFKPEMEQVAANTEGAETTPAAAAQPAEENA